MKNLEHGMKNDIKTKEDLKKIVTTFYSRIRKDVYLGPIFERHIQDWPSHLEHSTAFWENSLFRTGQYHGNPLEIHQKLDKKEGYRINEQHFGVWLNHWIQTIDDLFSGDNASLLKRRARKMSTHIHLHLFQTRKKL